METLNCIRCDFRHKDNGNCTAVGGFCTAVTAAHCPMLQKYLDTGLGPDEVTALQKDWSDLCTIVGECGGIGRVVVLPCKVGDTVYMISWRLNGRHEIEERVFSLTYFDPAKYGKDYFLSREEAEKALEEMKK